MELRVVKAIALVALWMSVITGLRAQTVVEYIHTDALGTPVAVTNAAGTVIERSFYEPNGQLINRPPTDGPGFTGHVQDAATGLTYMQQRYYDPGIGMMLSVDPVTALSNPVGQFHRYRYANNNPYKFTDPDGRAPCRNDNPNCDPRKDPIGQRRCAMTCLQNGMESKAKAKEVAGASAGSGGNKNSNLFMFPQNQGEGGFYNYGTPPNGAGQYGTGSALSTIFKAGHQWTLNGEENKFGVGNMSLKGGGPFAPHSSHRGGLDIDFRPMNIDGVQRGGITWRSLSYDRAATQRLVDVFHATGRVKVIYFNDPQINGVQPMPGHDDHGHIRVKP